MRLRENLRDHGRGLRRTILAGATLTVRFDRDSRLDAGKWHRRSRSQGIGRMPSIAV